jgi:hypothetical protein
MLRARDKCLLRGGEQTGTKAEQGRGKHISSIIIIEAEGQSASESSQHLGGGGV